MFKEIRNTYFRYLAIFVWAVIILFCAIELNFLWAFGYSPTLKDIKSPNLRVASELYTSDGKLIGRYYKENRTPVEYKKIAPSVVDALVATEDVRFFKHSGIDVRSLVGGIFSTLSGDKRGGSTITQQLAKNLYRTRYNKSQGWIRKIPLVRTFAYKLKEWMTAYKLERRYSKEEILTLYLNTVSYGSNAYGIKTASRVFFNKQSDQLTVPESALLVGVLNATTAYNPVRNPDKAFERRNIVLSQMNKNGYLSDALYEKYRKVPLKLTEGKEAEGSDGDSYLRNAVERYLAKWCEENNYDLNEDGLKIYTTIDSRLQQYAEEAVTSQMKLLQRRFDGIWGNQDPWQDLDGNPIENWEQKAAQRLPYYSFLKKKYANQPDSIEYHLSKKKKMMVFSWNGENNEKEVEYSTYDSLRHYGRLLNAGMMTLEPTTGKIKVWVGGIDNKYFKYDHVNQAKRQAGSTFKPFAYLAALESGMSPCDKFTDKPVSIPYDENNKEEVWEPKNADWSYSYREMTLRYAMGRSINTVTAQVTEKVGWDKVVEYAHKCGIESELKAVPSVSLGPNDVSVFEMVRAYGTFLNKGKRTDPILVEKITDSEGSVIEEFKPKEERALSEEIAWLMLYMLRGGMEEPGGTSQALWAWDLFKKGNQIGGKTGTSTEYVDGWYMGITKDLVTGVWTGCDERTAHFTSSETGEGSHTALPIFAKFMEKVYKDPNSGYTYGPFPKPWTKINREYNCVTILPKVDTTANDSLQVDSLGLPVIPDEPTTEEQKPPVQQQPPPVQQQPANSQNNPASVPSQNTKKLSPAEEKRQERLKKREERKKGNNTSD